VKNLPTKDWLSEKNARVLANNIRGYWQDRGHGVDVWTEMLPRVFGAKGVWVVRSDMVNGLPVRRLSQMAA